MSAEDFNEQTQQTYFERDGETWVSFSMLNILLFGPEIGAFEDLTVGPNAEFNWSFDDQSGDLTLLDQNDEVVVSIPPSPKQFGFDRLPLVPEYDAIAEVPDPSSDGPHSTEPTDPRGIVRFTETAASNEASLDVAGLYSYSIPEAGWVRLDRPK
jgi:hypothetical protein